MARAVNVLALYVVPVEQGGGFARPAQIPSLTRPVCPLQAYSDTHRIQPAYPDTWGDCLVYLDTFGVMLSTTR